MALPGLVAKCKAQTLRGRVIDSAGFVVTDAEVTATSKSVTSSIHTVRNGEFEFKDIAPPAYVTVHAAGSGS